MCTVYCSTLIFIPQKPLWPACDFVISWQGNFRAQFCNHPMSNAQSQYVQHAKQLPIQVPCNKKVFFCFNYCGTLVTIQKKEKNYNMIPYMSYFILWPNRKACLETQSTQSISHEINDKHFFVWFIKTQ